MIDFKKYLISYLKNSITPEQLDDLLIYIQKNPDEKELSETIDKVLRDNTFGGLTYDELSERSFRKLMAAIDTLSDHLPAKKKAEINDSGKIRYLWRYAVAASFLILVAIGSFWFLGNQLPRNKEVTAIQQVSDLVPGGNKAILLLADGSVIKLDAATEGILAQQDNAYVEKLNDGQIAYNITKEGATRVSDYNTISTPRGGQYQLTLSDGTVVWLNAESSIRFPVAFIGNERKVEISGEVYMEVTSDLNKPFEVVAGNTSIRVFGTAFNIRAYNNEEIITTTLIEGKVTVVHGESAKALVPGQQAICNLHGELSINDDFDIDELIAWKNGLFIFNGSNIREIMQSISKWYDVEIEYFGEPDMETYSGIVSRYKNVSEVLKIMEQSGIKFEIYENKIKVVI